MCFKLDTPKENDKIDKAISRAASGKIAKIPFVECSGLAYLMNRKKLEAKAELSGVAVSWIHSGAMLVKK